MSGEWDVGKIERGLTAKRLFEWEAYATIEPFSEMRGDFRVASLRKEIHDQTQRLVDVILAAQGVKKTDRPKIVDVDLEKFLLTWGEGKKPRRQQTWQEQLEIVQLIVHAYSVPGINT